MLKVSSSRPVEGTTRFVETQTSLFIHTLSSATLHSAMVAIWSGLQSTKGKTFSQSEFPKAATPLKSIKTFKSSRFSILDLQSKVFLVDDF